MQVGLVRRTRWETAARLGNDAGLIACAAIFGLGLGGLLHRVLIAAFERWGRLSVIPNAPRASLREDMLTVGPWAAIALSVSVYALMGRWRTRAWSWRRAAGASIAVAGAVVLISRRARGSCVPDARAGVASARSLGCDLPCARRGDRTHGMAATSARRAARLIRVRRARVPADRPSPRRKSS